MKEPMPTKKELANQTRELEEQVVRIKNRLNGVVFKKTKHGYRLDQLSDNTELLNRRMGELEQQLTQLGKSQQRLASMRLQHEQTGDELKNPDKEPKGKKRFRLKLGRLNSSISDLWQAQQQLDGDLSDIQLKLDQLGGLPDDLKLETDGLQSHVRGLEESSSRLAVKLQEQETRTRALEGLLAELTLAQERLAGESKAQAENISQQLSQAIAPLTDRVQQLADLTAEDQGRHKEVDRRLQQLANRVGDLGGHLHQLNEDFTDQRQRYNQLTLETDPWLQQYREGISEQLELLSSRISSVKTHADSQEQATDQQRDDIEPRIKHLEHKLGGIETELSELSEAGERLQESFRSLGGLELDLTSQLDELRQQLETTVQSEEAAEQTVQHETTELDDARAQAQPIPQFQENHRQQVDGQLDRIEELIRSEQERVSQLEDNFSQAQDKSERYRRELEQSQRLQLALEERLDGLSAQLAGLSEQGNTLTASMETQTGAQQALAEKGEELAKVQGALADRIDEQAREQRTLTEEVEQQRQEQRGLSERIEAHAQAQQALADRVSEQATQQSVLLQETESINALLARLELSDQESGSQISSIETQQRALQQQIEQEKPRIDAHDQRLQLLASNFEALDANGDELQLQIDKNQTTGRTHRNALIGLLLFMLLGGIALYLLNSAQINQSEERVTQKLVTTDPGDITRDDLSERMKALEAELTHNRERLTEAAAGVAEPVLLERLNHTEQQLERLAAALSSFEVDRQQERESEVGTLPAMAAELRQMQLEIERINGTLAQLSQSQTSVAQPAPLPVTGDSDAEVAQTAIANPPIVATAADAESGRLARIEQAYAQLQTQVSSWSEQLQTVQREQPVSRIAAIEQALQETTAQLQPQLGEIEKQRNAISRIERSLNNTRNHVEERLEQLEKHSSSTAEQQRQLADQVNQITTQLEKPQLSLAPQVQEHAVDWQLAQTAQRYSIQLAGARNLAALADFAARQSLQRDIAIYRTRHINREWYILLYGTYTGFREANEVLEELPAALNRFHPWIRKLPGDAERVR